MRSSCVALRQVLFSCLTRQENDLFHGPCSHVSNLGEPFNRHFRNIVLMFKVELAPLLSTVAVAGPITFLYTLIITSVPVVV